MMIDDAMDTEDEQLIQLRQGLRKLCRVGIFLGLLESENNFRYRPQKYACAVM